MKSSINLLQLTLRQLGWTSFFQQQLDPDSDLVPARVIRQDVNRYHLIHANGFSYGILPGKIRLEIATKAELPTVGDWVLVSPGDEKNSEQLVIQKTLERATKFSRKEAGDRFGEQVVAANIDTVFIVTGLDDNFNAGRIERYLLLTWTSGAQPVIVLNKLDLCDDVEKKIAKVNVVARGTPIHTISALTNTGLDELRSYLTEGTTAAVLGSSGVGKSTIINLLLGYDHFEVGDVREIDSKGRHTTTHRELCVTETGGLVIDTPGMREIQFWADSQALQSSFEDVETLATQCKFNDCRHQSEPKCAIHKAIEDGSLSEERYATYLKFQTELEHFAQRFNASQKVEKKTERKKFSKSIRNRPTKRD